MMASTSTTQGFPEMNSKGVNSMEMVSIDGVQLYYPVEEIETAQRVESACNKALGLVQAHWGLSAPQDCRVYVMTSLLDFVFHSAPWHWQVLMVITLPLWYFRESKVWQYAGGYAHRYGSRYVVGIKPLRLLQAGERGMGDQLFIREKDPEARLQHVVCHELTHACSAHLALPNWLQEGLAMLTVDRYFEKPTVRDDSLALFANAPKPGDGRSRAPQVMLYEYMRGYWLTRYIEETHPGFLKETFQQRISHAELAARIAQVYGLTQETFWLQADQMVLEHFSVPNQAETPAG
jgi:hypothetical protein